MRVTLRTLLVLTVVALVFGAAQAQTVSWKYAEAGYTSLNPDGATSQDGPYIGGTWEFGKETKFHVFGEYGDLGDFDQWSVGGGWHGLLGERADVVAEAAYVDIYDVDGFRISGGLRWMLLKRLELNGWVSYSDMDTVDQTSIKIGGIFDFTKRFGVGGSYDWGDDWDTTRAFVRFNFGARQ